ncbi:MAG: hypothetical protein EOO16_03885 [Chitinophagaceae bacterium]|nr:MAG: hypothetical protein EOO16_03885 [Chitinophagaceae bacterium]
MSGRQFLSGLSWLVVLNLLIKPVWVFGIDRNVQNSVGHAAYGTYFSILNLAIILAIVADAGLTNMLNRQLALREQVPLARLLQLKAGLTVVYLALLCFLCWLTHVRRWDLVFLIAGLQVLSSFLVFFRNVITGYQQFRADAWLSVADKLLTILVCAPLLYLPLARGISLQQFLWIQSAATALALALAIVIAGRHHERPVKAVSLTGLFRLSAPFVLLILLMGVHTRLDAFLLERMHPRGALEAGIYAAAYRLLDAGNTVGYMTASFLVPFAARHLADKPLINRTVLRLRHALLAAAVGFTVLCAAFAPQVMQRLYSLSGPYPARVLVLCVAVLPAYYGIHLYGSLLTASGRLAYFSRTMLGCVLLNTVLNIILIPRLGAAGCCIAALASQYACAAACFMGARTPFDLRLRPLSLLAIAAGGLLLCLAARTLVHAALP